MNTWPHVLHLYLLTCPFCYLLVGCFLADFEAGAGADAFLLVEHLVACLVEFLSLPFGFSVLFPGCDPGPGCVLTWSEL